MAIQGVTGFAQDTTLNTALSAGGLTAYLVDKVNWPNGSNDRFIIQIGSEYLLISLRVGNTLTIAARGYNGTTAAVHAAGVTATVLGYETIRTAFDAPGFLATLSPATSATGLTTFENTPSSANFAALITDESGTGAVILSTSPTITTPTISGVLNASGGTDTSASAVVTSPAVTSGVAFTPSATQNTQVTFQLGGVTGNYTITYGPTTGAENGLVSAVPTLLNVGTVVDLMVPKGWKVVLTLVTVTLTSTKVITF